ncbi:hypothetical protein [Demequina mangrovi]|uniref:Uncharacterized protein n=1 Tax=Demequina mangrovi TaxID=1043493 RepID=A0A1H6ZFA0_9MICO|nr:hypothetical protein [Demequina mangrovi]SEJ52051.1 hypothetical protein SAMN05421637_2121 [Demequina mangrovi]
MTTYDLDNLNVPRVLAADPGMAFAHLAVHSMKRRMREQLEPSEAAVPTARQRGLLDRLLASGGTALRTPLRRVRDAFAGARPSDSPFGGRPAAA